MGMDPRLLGFLLVLGAGSSTAIGAAVVYHPSLIKLASKKILGASLGISAGVMLYVSFIEIFSKSVSGFEDAGFAYNESYLYATLCFFGGVIMIRLIDKLVHYLANEDKAHLHGIDVDRIESRLNENEITDISIGLSIESDNKDNGKKSNENDKFVDETDKFVDEKVVESVEKGIEKDVGSEGISNDVDDCKEKKKKSSDRLFTFDHSVADTGIQLNDIAHLQSCHTGIGDCSSLANSEDDDDEIIKNRKLHRMGLFTALAIAIHNFPEGLATFVATLDDPAVGVSLAIAIAIHNVPEGLCVSVPIYYATGDRHKAFMWGVLSGLSEVLAAGLGWLILAYVFSDVIYGVLFGLVAGMMVSICMYELLPTARRYDPKDEVVTHCTMIGMVIMSVSLVAFLW